MWIKKMSEDAFQPFIALNSREDVTPCEIWDHVNINEYKSRERITSEKWKRVSYM